MSRALLLLEDWCPLKRMREVVLKTGLSDVPFRATGCRAQTVGLWGQDREKITSHGFRMRFSKHVLNLVHPMLEISIPLTKIGSALLVAGLRLGPITLSQT